MILTALTSSLLIVSLKEARMDSFQTISLHSTVVPVDPVIPHPEFTTLTSSALDVSPLQNHFDAIDLINVLIFQLSPQREGHESIN